MTLVNRIKAAFDKTTILDDSWYLRSRDARAGDVGVFLFVVGLINLMIATGMGCAVNMSPPVISQTGGALVGLTGSLIAGLVVFVLFGTLPRVSEKQKKAFTGLAGLVPMAVAVLLGGFLVGIATGELPINISTLPYFVVALIVEEILFFMDKEKLPSDTSINGFTIAKKLEKLFEIALAIGVYPYVYTFSVAGSTAVNIVSPYIEPVAGGLAIIGFLVGLVYANSLKYRVKPAPVVEPKA